MFPSYMHVSALDDRIRPDRRRVPSESEIRLRVKRVVRGA